MKDIKWQVLIAHAEGEDELAEQLAQPIREAGYEVTHRGTVMVGESFNEEASRALATGGPVVLCGTAKALGTGLAHHLVNAARTHQGQDRIRIFPVQMSKDVFMQVLTWDIKVATYWHDSTKAVRELIDSLNNYYPLDTNSRNIGLENDAEQRYRELVLESCDIIDLVNLPEDGRHIATQKLLLRQLYVALRVQVEIVSNAEVEEMELAAIEKRRIAMQRRRAGWSSEEKDEREDRGKRVPVGERLAKARRLVVLGDPGAGKTTMIRWITTAYLLRLKQDPDWKNLPDVSTLPDEDWLPIIIYCRDLKNISPIRSLDDILHYILRKHEMSEPECTALCGILIQKLKQGTALLLIDGLDEITDSLLRAEFCQRIEKICDAYKQAPIIVTSRIVGYREMKYRIGRQFEHVTVAELTKKDKDDFAHRWCDITELPERKKKAETELIQDIHSAERIERLTGNPMLLTTMALVKRKVGKLPTRRHKLYAQAVDVLLNWRSEVDKPIDDDEALPQLEYIAYAMCDRGVQQLRKDEVIELFEKFRQEYPNLHDVKNHTPKDFLILLEHRTGILVEAGIIPHNGRDVAVFEFRHLTFQEYLAGLALVRGHFPNRDRSLNFADYVAPLAAQINEMQVSKFAEQEAAVTENWQEALRLCVASCNDDDVDQIMLAILKPLQAEDAKITTRPRAVLAALCLADEPNVSVEVAQEVLKDFVKQLSENDGRGILQSSVDFAAMEVAASQWVDMLLSKLVKAFQEREPRSRSNFGGMCGMISRRSILEHEVIIFEWLLQQVSKLGSSEEESIKAALSIMQSAYQEEALIIPGMIDGLLEMLKGSGATSHAAAWALAWLNHKKQKSNAWQPTDSEMEQLISCLKNLTFDTEAIKYISWIVAEERELKAVEPLICWLASSNSWLRTAAVQALAAIGANTAVEPLINKLDDPDKDVQQAAEQALLKLGHRQTINNLLEKLSANDRHTRVSSLKKLLYTCKDEIDRQLLSWDLDDFDPFLDPQEEINEERVNYAAAELEIAVEEVRMRYQKLAQQFGLRLNFTTDA